MEALIMGGPGFPQLASLMHEIGFNFTVNMLAEDIRNFTPATNASGLAPERVAEIMLSAMWGWYRAEAMVRKVDLEEAMAYAQSVVDLVVAGRSLS